LQLNSTNGVVIKAIAHDATVYSSMGIPSLGIAPNSDGSVLYFNVQTMSTGYLIICKWAVSGVSIECYQHTDVQSASVLTHISEDDLFVRSTKHFTIANTFYTYRIR